MSHHSIRISFPFCHFHESPAPIREMTLSENFLVLKCIPTTNLKNVFYVWFFHNKTPTPGIEPGCRKGPGLKPGGIPFSACRLSCLELLGVKKVLQ